MDAFELLRLVNPVPDAAVLPNPRTDPVALAMLERVLGDGARAAVARHRHCRRRPRAFLLPGITVVATAAITAAAAWQSPRVEPPPSNIVACYEQVDLRANLHIVLADPDPVVACGAAWRQGLVQGVAPGALAACVLDTGAVAVFPADDGDPCDRLGIAAAKLPSEARRHARLLEVLTERFRDGCPSIAAARDVLANELSAAGVIGWRLLQPELTPPAGSCTSVDVDAETRTVTLVSRSP